MRIVDPDTCQVLDDCQVGKSGSEAMWLPATWVTMPSPKLPLTVAPPTVTVPICAPATTASSATATSTSPGASNTIIVGGENYFPSDIEELVAAANLGFTTAQCCATQPDIDGPWYLVMGEAANIDILDRTAYSGLLSRAIARSTGKQPARVLWTDNALPRTSSGKIARGEVAQLALQILAEQQRDGSTAHYDNAGGRGTSGASKGSDDSTEGADSEDPDGEAGSRNSAAAASTDPTQHPVVVQLADQLSCPPDAVDLRADVSELGLTSLAVNEFLSWAGHTGHTLDPVEVWENPTVGAWMGLYDLAAAATAQQGDAADGTSVVTLRAPVRTPLPPASPVPMVPPTQPLTQPPALPQTCKSPIW
ncbi:MAG: non-ribosomal peptide synthetase [Lawsonella clevelandensis]